ncbi:unnamed protein product, partial [Amoebophrya sp. A120]
SHQQPASAGHQFVLPHANKQTVHHPAKPPGTTGTAMKLQTRKPHFSDPQSSVLGGFCIGRKNGFSTSCGTAAALVPITSTQSSSSTSCNYSSSSQLQPCSAGTTTTSAFLP